MTGRSTHGPKHTYTHTDRHHKLCTNPVAPNPPAVDLPPGQDKAPQHEDGHEHHGTTCIGHHYVAGYCSDGPEDADGHVVHQEQQQPAHEEPAACDATCQTQSLHQHHQLPLHSGRFQPALYDVENPQENVSLSAIMTHRLNRRQIRAVPDPVELSPAPAQHGVHISHPVELLFTTERMVPRSAYLTSHSAPLQRDDGRQECIPASLGCQADRVVGDGTPDEGLHKGDRQAHDGGGNHKRPAGEEEIISLLEEDFHAINLQAVNHGRAGW